MKKLIIQIPCLNEAETLPSTLRDLPRQIPGIDTIEVLVIDDGSTDSTVQVAQAAGVQHIISLHNRRGLATAFTTGIDAALKLGADFIVNTDGDNQYAGSDIATLVAPLVNGEADVVIGDRNVETLKHLTWTRKRLQHLGSWVVRQVSNTRVPIRSNPKTRPSRLFDNVWVRHLNEMASPAANVTSPIVVNTLNGSCSRPC